MHPGKRTPKNIYRGILSIILGFIGGSVTFIILIFIFMATGLFGWSDGGSQASLRRLEANTNITGVISMVVALFVFIIIIIKVNQNRTQDPV